MKKIITLATLGLMITAAPIVAQTVYDAAKITNKDLNGTARFVGMGGAMMRWCHLDFLPMELKVTIWVIR